MTENFQNFQIMCTEMAPPRLVILEGINELDFPMDFNVQPEILCTYPLRVSNLLKRANIISWTFYPFKVIFRLFMFEKYTVFNLSCPMPLTRPLKAGSHEILNQTSCLLTSSASHFTLYHKLTKTHLTFLVSKSLIWKNTTSVSIA